MQDHSMSLKTDGQHLFAYCEPCAYSLVTKLGPIKVAELIGADCSQTQAILAKSKSNSVVKTGVDILAQMIGET